MNLKHLRKIDPWLLVFTIISCGIGQAQETADSPSSINPSALVDPNGVVALSGTNIPSLKTWSDEQLAELVTALDATPTIPLASLPRGGIIGTYWSLQNPSFPPLPGDTIGATVWPMEDGSFLLNDVNYDYNAPSAQPAVSKVAATGFKTRVVTAKDGGPPIPGGGGTNTYSPNDVTNTPPDYGTNLWIASPSVSAGLLTGFGSNTLADVEYEIQSRTNLAQSDWQTEGYIYGSELTNWTQLSVVQNGRTNLFIRLKSWESSDGSGIPDWWESEYFGTNSVDLYADPAGDGYDNLYKFEHGMNPNVFYTPAAPQFFNVVFNANSNTATLTWVPSQGNVTGYTLEKTDSYNYPPSVQDISLSSTLTSYRDTFSSETRDPYNGNNYDVSYRLVALYTNGSSSAWTAPLPLQQITVSASISPGTNGGTFLAISGVPANASLVRLVFIDENAVNNGDNSFEYNENISVSSFTNGVFQLPQAWLPPSTDPYGSADYWMFAESVDAGGDESAANFFDGEAGWPTAYNWGTPFYDGRVQLKQDLIFQLRAAPVDGAFQFTYFPVPSGYGQTYVYPTNYAVASLYQFANQSVYPGTFDAFLPFEDNYLFENFVFNSSRVDAAGNLTTGVSGGNGSPNYALTSPAFAFTSSVTPYQAWLTNSSTTWLLYDQINGFDDIQTVGIVTNGANGQSVPTISMASGAFNWFGLPYFTIGVAGTSATTGNPVNDVISAGETVASDDFNNPYNVYTQTEQPGFQTVEYDFFPYENFPYTASVLPGDPQFSTTNTSRLLVTSVGDESYIVAGYAKLAVTNSVYARIHENVYGYLGQYFDAAYTMTNGVATSTNTGVLSPYGNFMATQPGETELITMADPDTQERGTCTVYAVSLQLDKNHDGTMDLSVGGSDSTSQGNPMVAWVNDGYTQPGTDGNYDKDLPLPGYDPANANSQIGQITCVRDLENFFRLWMCGMPPLPANAGYSVTLAISPITENPAINLYLSCETNGGIGYLTNTDVAANQAGGLTLYNRGLWHYNTRIGAVSNNLSYTFPDGTFSSGGTQYLLFEGAGIGEGQLTLTISQNSNILCKTSVYVDLHDIGDFYEFARAENVPDTVPPSSLVSQYSVPTTIPAAQNESKQILVFVHGINNTEFDAQNATAVIYKRLYWSGYRGRVAEFRWPCGYFPFDNTWYPFEYNESEFWAYKSANAFKNYMSYLQNRSDLAGYSLNILAHSQGNAVVSEALSDGAPFTNYILSQGAVPAHCYDTNAPQLQVLLNAEATTPTPYAASVGGYNGCWTNISGNLIDFFNTNDFALVSGTVHGLSVNWVANQAGYKPEAFVGGPSYVFYPSNQTSVAYYTFGSHYTVTDFEESRSMVARSRTSAVGAQGGLGGVIKSSVDLKTSFGFGSTRPEHSAEFARPVQTSLGYYQTLLLQIAPEP